MDNWNYFLYSFSAYLLYILKGEKMKKNDDVKLKYKIHDFFKKKSVIFILEILIVVIIAVFIAFLFNKKQNNLGTKIYNEYVANYNEEALRYKKIASLEEDKLLSYLGDTLSSEKLIPMTAAEYILVNSWDNLTTYGRSTVFNFYYQEMQLWKDKYQTMLTNSTQTSNQLYEFAVKGGDISDIEYVTSIKDIYSEVVLLEMKLNHIGIVLNGEQFYLYVTYDGLLDNRDLFDDEYIKFMELSNKLESKPLQNAQGYVDFENLEETIFEYEDFLNSTVNAYLRSYIAQTYNYLMCVWTGATDVGLIQNDLGEYEYPEEFLNSYNDYILNHKDSDTANLLKVILDKIEGYKTQEDFTNGFLDLKNTINDFIYNKDWDYSLTLSTDYTDDNVSVGTKE